MMEFEFCLPQRVVFGNGRIASLADLAGEFGKSVLLVTGGSSLRVSGVLDSIIEGLRQRSLCCTEFSGISHEPTVEDIDAGCAFARQTDCEVVVGIGGGSVLDAAKAISGLLTNGGSVLDYLEGVGKGKKISKPSVPFIAIPTTAGTGSEVTKNAVIRSDKMKFKKSIRSLHLIPNIALLDPELTLDLPPNITAQSGMDALTQVIEAYISRKAQPLASAIAIDGIRRIGNSILAAYENGNDLSAREQVLLGAHESGIALANAGLGAVHGLASAFGALYAIPHGLACAILLPHVLKRNLPGLPDRAKEIAVALSNGQFSGSNEDASDYVIFFVEQLNEKLGIPCTFADFDIPSQDIDAIVSQSRGSSMSGNPVDLSDGEIAELVEKVL